MHNGNIENNLTSTSKKSGKERKVYFPFSFSPFVFAFEAETRLAFKRNPKEYANFEQFMLERHFWESGLLKFVCQC
jgi:hypothetical protein